jgi:hypothetical protein
MITGYAASDCAESSLRTETPPHAPPDILYRRWQGDLYAITDAEFSIDRAKDSRVDFEAARRCGWRR